MKPIDLDKLIDWLGPEGAIAGLDAGSLTVADLLELGEARGLPIDKKVRKKSIAIELVNSKIQRIDKSQEELLRMRQSELKSYFEDRMVSNAELLKLLGQLGIAPRSDETKNLLEFAAREIGELGMYQRVAKGKSAR